MELSRRTFVKFCGAAAGALGLSATNGGGSAAAQEAGSAAGGGGVILPRPDRPLRCNQSARLPARPTWRSS